tara:strand:- start:2767 stop:4275 length:1509 start_codon:yes stop_codon:yes gene_type:complete
MSNFTNSKIIKVHPSVSTNTEILNIDELSLEQKVAYDKFILGNNIFVSGPGGTGKTKLIQYFVQHANKTYKKIQVCAMTGCAANILTHCNARTLHSWSGIRLAKGPNEEIINSVMKNFKCMNNWKKIKCLIIDEVSMLSLKILKLLNELAKKIRNSEQPFGGIQIVFTGDFYQLPPVGNSNNDIDSNSFCFQSLLWNTLFSQDNHIILTKIFRQKDQKYINILQQIRMGKIDEDNIEILKQYVDRKKDDNDITITKLFSLRSKVDYINSTMYSKINDIEYIYKTIVDTNYIDCHGKYIPKTTNTLNQKIIDYEINHLITNMSSKQTLSLKTGSTVMCTVNLDLNNGICNGSQGTVIGFTNNDSHYPIVKFYNGTIRTLSPYYWVSENYSNIAIGQIPLILAWAITIHKIQGATLKTAEIDIGKTIFESGQTYVALSRIESLDGLYLSSFDPNKIKTNELVNNFYENIPFCEYKNYEFSFSTKELNFEKYEYEDSNNIKKIFI